MASKLLVSFGIEALLAERLQFLAHGLIASRAGFGLALLVLDLEHEVGDGAARFLRLVAHRDVAVLVDLLDRRVDHPLLKSAVSLYSPGSIWSASRSHARLSVRVPMPLCWASSSYMRTAWALVMWPTFSSWYDVNSASSRVMYLMTSG